MKIGRLQGLILEWMNKVNIKNDFLFEVLENIPKLSKQEVIDKLDAVPEEYWLIKYYLLQTWLICHKEYYRYLNERNKQNDKRSVAA